MFVCLLRSIPGCDQVWYCGVSCQRLAWTLGNHRRLCKRWAAERVGSEGTKAKEVGRMGGREEGAEDAAREEGESTNGSSGDTATSSKPLTDMTSKEL